MKFIFLLIAIAVIILLFEKAKKGGNERDKKSGTAPYFKKNPVSEPEQVLFHRLKEALPNQIILAQVSMSALIGIRKNPNWQSQFNEISRKYVDFVICNTDFSTAAVIELDDSTHQNGERIKADAVKDAAFIATGIKIIRYDVREMPTVEKIRGDITSEPKEERKEPH